MGIESPDPVPGPGELLICTRSTAICASDVHFMDHHDAVPAREPAGMVYDPPPDPDATSSSATSSSAKASPTGRTAPARSPAPWLPPWHRPQRTAPETRGVALTVNFTWTLVRSARHAVPATRSAHDFH